MNESLYESLRPGAIKKTQENLTDAAKILRELYGDSTPIDVSLVQVALLIAINVNNLSSLYPSKVAGGYHG